MDSQLNSVQLEQTVRKVCKVIGQIPCFHLYEDHIARRFRTEVEECALRDITRNAALDSALVNLRCFNEFLKAGGKKDDVRAHHFSASAMGEFLTSEEEKEINKYVAHLTVNGLEIATKPWNIDSMTIRGLEHGIQFLSLIEAEFPMESKDAYAELRGVRAVAMGLIKRITRRDGNQGS